MLCSALILIGMEQMDDGVCCCDELSQAYFDAVVGVIRPTQGGPRADPGRTRGGTWADPEAYPGRTLAS